MYNNNNNNEKVLFLHVPKNIDNNSKIYIMPMGLIALASYVNKKYSSRVMHIDLEKAINPNFSLKKFIKKKKIDIICLDLHWHYQTYRVINTAKEIKKNFPKIKIILGGFTASFFHKEILNKFLFIDYIIKGDGENAILNLIDHIYQNKSFENVPNLSWREKKKIKSNQIIVNSKLIDRLDYADFKLLYNSEKYGYIEFLGQNFNINNLKAINSNRKVFFFNCGKGCLVNCTYCGGSNISQRLINNRGYLIKMKIDSAIKNLKKAIDNGYNCWMTDFYPTGLEEYYLKLFERLREEKLILDVIFTIWSLPTKKFIESFKKTFSSGSELVISPDTGSEKIRKLNKGYYYTNQELLNSLKMLKNVSINFNLHFGVGFSNEKKEDIIMTMHLIKKIRDLYPEIEMTVSTIESEPGSPVYLNPEKFGIINERKNFIDFYKVHKFTSDIGYRTKFLSKEEIISALEELRVIANKGWWR